MSRRVILSYTKKVSIGAILILLLLLIKNITTSIISTQQRSQILSELEVTLQAKKEEEALLSQKLSIAKTDKFVEDEARSKLGLVKPGEKIVVDEKIMPIKEKIMPVEPPNWKKWLSLFI